MDVTIIIVHYNCPESLTLCLSSIQKHVDLENKEVVIIDNASIQKPNEIIHPKIRYIYLPENIGFGRANQKGIEIAKGEYIFLLNPDTVLNDDACETFKLFLDNPQHQHIACCGGHLYNSDNTPTPSYGNFPGIVHSIASLGFYLLFKNYYYQYLETGVNNTLTKPSAVDYISGANWFVRKSVLDELGGFDPDFFLYFEETELAWRIKRKGYQSWILPHVRILHEEGVSSKFNSQKFNELGYHLYVKHKRLFYQKVYGVWYDRMVSPIDFLAMLLKTIAKRDFHEIGPRIRAWKRA